ncbi:MAG: hypothetical protein V3U60_16265 [Gammaproteobacteria bacterium]
MTYLGDYAEDYTTLNHAFTTLTAAKVPTTLAGSPVIAVYKGSAVGTEKTSAEAYITLAVDFDGITGLNNILIDLSADAFFATGEDYKIAITTGTVDGVSAVGTVVATFSIQNRHQAAATSASGSVNTTAESFVETVGGGETNSYTATLQLDGVLHSLAPDVIDTDGYYQFDIGGNGVPSSITWEGYANHNGDSYAVYAYNYGTTTYEQIGTIIGAPQILVGVEIFNLTTNHVGTGVDLGKVRFRILSVDGINFSTDRIYCSYAVVAQSVGYANGALWLNTAASNTNTEPHVDGVADNPVSTLAALLTLSGTVGLNRFQMAQGSALTFVGTMDNYELLGLDYSIDLNGQQVDNSTITGAVVTGVCTGNGGSLLLERCKIGPSTFPEVSTLGSALVGPIVLSESGVYFYDRCSSAIAGQVAVVIDYGAAGAQELNMRHHSGGVHVKNMTALDVMSLEGQGQLIVDASCSGGAISYRGNFDLTDNSGGAVTLNGNACFSITSLLATLEALESYNLMRAVITGKYLVSEANRTIIFYDTDGTTELVTFTYSADGTTRTVA